MLQTTYYILDIFRQAYIQSSELIPSLFLLLYIYEGKAGRYKTALSISSQSH